MDLMQVGVLIQSIESNNTSDVTGISSYVLNKVLLALVFFPRCVIHILLPDP